MDTLFLRLYSDKTLGWIFLTALTVFLLSFFLAARATENIAYYISPPLLESTRSIDTEVIKDEKILQEEFDEKIKTKYPGAKIRDLTKGVKQISVTRYFNSRPVRLNIIETDFKLNKGLMVKPTIAGNTLNHKAKIRYLNEKEKAIVSVNGGFFKPQTGVPLGLLMIDGRVYTGQIYDRVALGVFEDGFKMARAKAEITLKADDLYLSIDNINQPRMLSTYTLVYDNLWGEYSPPAPKHGIVFSIRKGKIIEISTSPIKIPKDGFVVSAPKSKVVEILKTKKIILSTKINPNWSGVKHIISGGPYLIKDGEVYIDVTAQKLTSITGKNPRTAIGYTSEGNIIIITADGREKASVGLTLGELARYMKQLGCINAMNLDGGSSTVMYGGGEVLNSPSAVGGILISNAVNIISK